MDIARITHMTCKGTVEFRESHICSVDHNYVKYNDDVYRLTASSLHVTEGTSLAVGHIGTAAVPVQVQLCNPVIRQSASIDLC